ncbi:carboxymethylenebutenolidase homolog [Glandiceps talaboti]
MSRVTTILVVSIGTLLFFCAVLTVFSFMLYYTGRELETGGRVSKASHSTCQDDDITNLKGVNIAINGKLRAFVVPVECSNGTGVIILNDESVFQSEYIVELAYDLGRHGYTVVVPDLLRGLSFDGESEYENWAASLNQSQVDILLNDSLDYIRRYHNIRSIGVVGFGWGGTQVVLASRYIGRVQAGVSFHPRPFSINAALSMLAPTLFIYAENDTSVHFSEVYKVQDIVNAAHRLLSSIDANDSFGGPPVFFDIFPNMTNGFTYRNDINGSQVSEMSAKAISDMYTWFRLYLPREYT